MLNLQLCLKMSLLDHSVSLTIKHLFPTLFSSWTKSIIHAAALWVWNCYQASLELFVHSCWRKKKKNREEESRLSKCKVVPICLFISWHARVSVKVPVSFFSILSTLTLHGMFPSLATSSRRTPSTCRWDCTYATWMAFLNEFCKDCCGSVRSASRNWEIWERSEVFCARFTWKRHWGS